MPQEPKRHKPFVYGDPLTQSEYAEVRSRLFPDWRKRLRRVPVGQLLSAVQQVIPQRLAFEVDRLHGLAVDIGEAGSSYTVIKP